MAFAAVAVARSAARGRDRLELLGIIATSVLFTWLFDHTDGSLLLALLFPASIATTGLFLAESRLGPAVDVVLAWLLAAVVTARSADRDQPEREYTSP